MWSVMWWLGQSGGTLTCAYDSFQALGDKIGSRKVLRHTHKRQCNCRKFTVRMEATVILSAQNVPSTFVPNNRQAQVKSEKEMLAPGDAYVPSSVSPLATAISGAVIGAGAGLLAASTPGVGGQVARGVLGATNMVAGYHGYSRCLKDRGFSDYKAGGYYGAAMMGLPSVLTAFSGASTQAKVTLGVLTALVGGFGGYALAKSVQEQ